MIRYFVNLLLCHIIGALCSDNHRTLLRGNSVATKAVEAYMKLVGEKVR